MVKKLENRRRGAMIIYNNVAQAIERTEVLKSYGANLIRWQLNTLGTNYPNYASYKVWLNSQLDIIEDSIVSKPRLFNKVKIIIDLHHPPANWLKKNSGRNDFFDAWQTIADRFKNKSQILGYDLVNEPGFISHRVYQRVMQTTAKLVREIDNKSAIIVECKLGRPKQMKKLKPLNNIDNVWYSSHFYEPGFITYQGMINPIPAKPKQYPTKNINKDLLVKLLAPVKNFQDTYGTRIYMGEFGCSRFSGWPNHHNQPKWFADVIDIFEDYGWDWSFHAFREHHGWDIERGRELSDFAFKDTRKSVKVFKKVWKNNK